MKFNTTTILGLAYVMMLMGAHVLAIREKVSFERTSHRHRTIRKGRKAHSKTKGECPPDDPKFNYISFFFSALMTSMGDIQGDILGDMQKFY